MKAIEVREGIYWVGGIDWSVRSFHGYATNRGSTYGAYLIIDEKITLIDTVKAEFTGEMLERIESIVPVEDIDIIISNHVEMDHSGSLPVLQERCKKATIYTSGVVGVKGLQAHYGEYPYVPLKAGEVVSLGKRSLAFVATPMLHWPDNMVTYCPEEKILFSNDAFGQHLASSERFDDQIDLSVVMEESAKYYANIIMCFGMQVQKAWNVIKDLDIEMIAPSHGVIWRSHVKEIIDAYVKWSSNTPENSAVIVYDSMWHSTEKMATAIAEGFTRGGATAVKVYDLKKNHWSDIVPAILKSKYIAVGSPTLNNQMMPNVAAFLCYLKGLSPKGREAIAFGSFGWSGQSVGMIEKELESCGFHICTPAMKITYIPTKEQLDGIEDAIENLMR